MGVCACCGGSVVHSLTGGKAAPRASSCTNASCSRERGGGAGLAGGKEGDDCKKKKDGK